MDASGSALAAPHSHARSRAALSCEPWLPKRRTEPALQRLHAVLGQERERPYTGRDIRFRDPKERAGERRPVRNHWVSTGSSSSIGSREPSPNNGVNLHPLSSTLSILRLMKLGSPHTSCKPVMHCCNLKTSLWHLSIYLEALPKRILLLNCSPIGELFTIY